MLSAFGGRTPHLPEPGRDRCESQWKRWSGGSRIARATASSSAATVFYYPDHLASTRLELDASSNTVSNCTFLPFGALFSCSPDDSANHYKFTGMESDNETALNHTWFRQQFPNTGRWLSPDPAGLAAVDVSNPQSLNRYAYALNSPMTYVDPLGLNVCTALVRGWIDDRGNITIWEFRILHCDEGAEGGGEVNSSKKPNEACKRGLKNAKKNTSAIARAQANWDAITSAANKYGIDPAVLAAIGVRETGFKNIPQGGGCCGNGVWQIDSLFHPGTQKNAYDVAWASNYAAQMVADNTKRYSTFGVDWSTAPAIRDYNTGPKWTFGKMMSGMDNFDILGSLDRGTTWGNYASNVMDIAQCF